MKKSILYLILLILITSCKSQSISYSYEAVCNGIGSNGTYLVKIYTYGKNTKKAKDLSRSHAIHAVLFKGISGSTLCQSQKPICNTSYSEKKEWFDSFFKSGDYLQYISFTNGGYVDADDVLKIKLKTHGGKYKVGVAVTIMKDQLRKRMEKEGFARALTQGF